MEKWVFVEISGERIFAILELDFQRTVIWIGSRPMAAWTTFFLKGIISVRRHDDDSGPLRHAMPLVSMIIIWEQFTCVKIYS